jgi:hypothetical protein
MGRRFGTIGLGLAALVLLVGIGFLVGTMWQPSTELSLETGKLFLQAIFVVALGALVAFFVDFLKKRAEQREERSRKAREAAERERDYATDTLKSFLERTDVAYREVKRLRRRLQGRMGPELGALIAKQDYWDAMLTLDELQMELEQLQKDAEAVVDRVPELAAIAQGLGRMEKYLGLIWKEAERRFVSLDDSFSAADEHLERVSGFLASSASGRGDFWVFANLYHDNRRSLVSSLSARLLDLPWNDVLDRLRLDGISSTAAMAVTRAVRGVSPGEAEEIVKRSGVWSDRGTRGRERTSRTRPA